MAERKRYIEVEAPILNEKIRILGTLENLPNKTIKIDLSRKLKGKSAIIKLRIFNIENKLIAVPDKLEITKSYVRRIIRKRTNYVEDSFMAKCSDVRVTIKPLLVTRNKVSRAVRKNLRNTAKTHLIEYVKNKTFNEICQELLDGTLSKSMQPKLKKVYPLAFSDLRVFETKEIQKSDIASLAKKEEKKEKESLDEEIKEDSDEKEEIKEEKTTKKSTKKSSKKEKDD